MPAAVVVERAVAGPLLAQIPARGFLAPGSSGMLASAIWLKPAKLLLSSLVVLRSVVVLLESASGVPETLAS